MKFLVFTCKFYDFFLLFFFFVTIDSFQMKFSSKFLEGKNQLLPRLRAKREEANQRLANNYLTKYGYINPGALHANDDTAKAENDWKKSLREMQSFLGLKPTGELDAETLAMMKRPRCANHDKTSTDTNERRQKRYVRVGSKWHSKTITYSIDNYTPKLGKKRTHEAIDAAFGVWSKHVALHFKKVTRKEHPDIVTFFAEGYHNDNTAFDGVGGYLAHAYYPGTGIGGDTHFDGAEPWTLHKKAYEGNDLFLVAVHELGHALGLGHSMNQEAIMAPVYRHHDTKNFQLPQDDILGIQSIYENIYNKPVPPLSPTTTLPPDRVPPPSTTTRYYSPRTRRPSRRPPSTRATRTPLSSTSEPLPPDVCQLTHYDAVSFLRRELYVFSGEYMWRRQKHDQSMQGPYKITSFWSQMTDGVDAVYENPETNTIVFFKGEMYYEYDGITLRRPAQHVRNLGLDNEHIGAAVWWENNAKTYFFQDSRYWRLFRRRVEPPYPKRMDIWKGAPTHVDAAFSGIDEDGRNHTYFVKGTDYWKLNNVLVRVVEGPRSFRTDWLRCEYEISDPVDDEPNSVTAIVVTVVIFSIVFIVVAIIALIRRRNARAVEKHSTGKLSVDLPKYAAAVPAGQYPPSGKKSLLVTTAQQKLRWCRFSLQGQV